MQEKSNAVLRKREINCPNCGAPITGSRCEYCGTVFADEMRADTIGPSKLSISQVDEGLVEIGGKLFRLTIDSFEMSAYEPMTVHLTGYEVSTSLKSPLLFADNKMYEI